jgi:two-component system, cell cycle sensor histidine kinase and response regulator CckA
MDKIAHERHISDSSGQAVSPVLRILFLEDNPQDVELCIQELKKTGTDLTVDTVDNEEAFAACLQSRVYDLILSDYRIPGWSGAEAFKLLKRSGKHIPFILVTGTLGEEAAVELIKEGVAEYVLKDRLVRLPLAVGRALHEKAARDEHTRTVEALARSEARLRRLVESSIIGIGIGTLDGKLIDGNDAFLKVIGFSREEILSGTLRWDELTPPEYRDIDQLAVEHLRKNGVAPPWEKEFIRKDGSRVAVLIGVVTLAVEGDLEAVSFVVDISERKQLERQLRQAQKMEAVGQLAGGIAHDFNNLLGVIIGYSEIFEERLGPHHPLLPKAEQIKKAGLRAASLTRQLLAFSRKQVLDPKVLGLNAVVADTLKMLQRLIGEDIELITIQEPELGLVKADQGQIEQVIMNLAVNARDAMPKGGRLTIVTGNAELDETYARQHPAATPGSYVMLSVGDTGCGMDPETQTHIFEPFFTTKELGKGTGLGLATVYGVVKQSGGYVWVYSEVGRGSTFKIYLPRVGEGVTATRPSTADHENLRGWETVLLVEDAQPLRELARELLEDSGYTVLEAKGGAEAIEIAQQHQGAIHLLMTDVVMPGMDGPKVAECVSRICTGIKVLYASGYTDDAIVHHGVLDSGVALLQKPFTRESLTRKVREALGPLESHAASSPSVGSKGRS